MAEETVPEVMRQLESHLTFAASLLSSAPLDGHRRELGDQLAAIRARHADPNLYLAVVGEFSSGKSTFVNALLGEQLLPTSAVITTAVPTELAPGGSAEVRLQLAGAARIWVLPRDRVSLRTELSLRSVPIRIPPDADDALRSLVTSDKIGALVSSLRYSCPNEFLGRDIVVVDTPGLNATAEHDQVTERVVADRADAFIVLTASMSAFGANLLGFLRTHLADQMRRSIFVVTKMDLVDDDVARFERVISGRLRKHLEPAPSGPVHYLALGPALSAEAADSASWAARFEDFRSSLRERLRLNRAVVVAETTTRLLESLLARISELISERMQELSVRQRQLDAIEMPDVPRYLAAVSSKLQSRQEASLSVASRSISAESARLKTELTAEIRQGISAARSMSEFRTYVDGFGTRAARAVSRLSDHATSAASKLMREDSAALAAAAEDFRREYAKVESLRGGPLPTASAQISVTAPKPASHAINAHDFGQPSGVTVARFAGAAGAGAIVGSILFPGPGTLIGAAIGALLGASSSKALEKAKSEGRAALIAEVDRLWVSADAELAAWLAACRKAEAARIVSVTSELEYLYEPNVRAAMAEAHQRQAQLEHEQQQLNDLAASLRNRLEALSKLRAVLAAMGTADTVGARSG